MDLYRFKGANGDHLEVLAKGEAEARKLIMCARWGEVADAIVPAAPHYSGYGLDLVDVVHNYKGKVELIARIKGV